MTSLMDEKTIHYYDHHVFCCLNERKAGHERGCCASKGAQDLFNYFKVRMKELGLQGADGTSRVNKAGCLDRCEEGPVLVVYPQGIWYRYETRADVDEIISEHFQNNRIVKRLVLDNMRENI